MFYVYKLIDPRTNLPFYVGKGKGRRSKVHFNPSSAGQNPYKDSVIRQIQDDGYEVLIEHIPCNSEREAYSEEVRLILQLGRRDIGTGILTNLQNGGEGAGTGRVLSAATRARISDKAKGKIRVIASHGGTPIIQHDTEGQEIARYPSARAASKATGVDGTHILLCCKGKCSSAKGFVWKYANSTVIPRSKLIKRAVLQLNLDGSVVAEYESVSAAAKAMSTGISYISKAVTNNDIAFGYRWSGC